MKEKATPCCEWESRAAFRRSGDDYLLTGRGGVRRSRYQFANYTNSRSSIREFSRNSLSTHPRVHQSNKFMILGCISPFAFTCIRGLIGG